MEKFEQAKQKQLAMKDKSSIGEWDEKIRKLCDEINKKKEYYTTSSCAGRIILIKTSLKKEKNLFLFRMHRKISFEELKREMKKAAKAGNADFQQSPCILHVAASSVEAGQILLDKAKFAGWKRSGMMAMKKRVVLELMSTEHIELPVIREKKLIIDDNFLKILASEANEKLARTWEKIQKLEKLI